MSTKTKPVKVGKETIYIAQNKDPAHAISLWNIFHGEIRIFKTK